MSQEDTFHIVCTDCFSSAGLGWEEFLTSSLKAKIILLFLNQIPGLGGYRLIGLDSIVSKVLEHTLKEKNIKDRKIRKIK